jgi:hypothetical protein
MQFSGIFLCPKPAVLLVNATLKSCHICHNNSVDEICILVTCEATSDRNHVISMSSVFAYFRFGVATNADLCGVYVLLFLD